MRRLHFGLVATVRGERCVCSTIRQKRVLQRWPASISKGAEFARPTAR